jgi:hypothetical protein
VLVNLFGVYVAVGGIACLASAVSDRRGPAIGFVFTVVLASFLLNFLARFWEPAERFAFPGLLNYYRPNTILSDGVLSLGHVSALFGFGLVLWIAGGVALARRSICTV